MNLQKVRYHEFGAQRFVKDRRRGHKEKNNNEKGEEVRGGSRLIQNVEERSEKGKKTKPTCHLYGKKAHTTNVNMSKKTNQQEKSKNKGHYHKCNKQGHQTQDTRY